MGFLRKIHVLRKIFIENSVFSFFQLQWSSIAIEKKMKTEFSLNIFLKAWFFLKIPTKGLYPAYNGEIWTGFDLFFVPKNLFQTNYTFLYCKFGHFPLFYKNMVRGLKIQAIYNFFWDSGPYDSHTSLCQRAARVVGCCANQGTLM